MTDYFPIPSTVSNIWMRDPLGRGSVRNMERWAEIERERDHARMIATAWRDCAVLDGWTLEPTYEGGEPAESHGTIHIETRIGTFKGHVDARPSRRGEDERNWMLGSGEVTIWGPDGLQIKTPRIYPGIEAIIAATRVCSNCKAEDVETLRYSFAGRCCRACLPEMQRIHEQPGWCD